MLDLAATVVVRFRSAVAGVDGRQILCVLQDTLQFRYGKAFDMHHGVLLRGDDHLPTAPAVYERHNNCRKGAPHRSAANGLHYLKHTRRGHQNPSSDLAHLVLDPVLIQELNEGSEAVLEQVNG